MQCENSRDGQKFNNKKKPTNFWIENHQKQYFGACTKKLYNGDYASTKRLYWWFNMEKIVKSTFEPIDWNGFCTNVAGLSVSVCMNHSFENTHKHSLFTVWTRSEFVCANGSIRQMVRVWERKMAIATQWRRPWPNFI